MIQLLIVMSIIIALWILGGQKKGHIRDVGSPLSLGIATMLLLPGADYGKRVIAGIATIALAQIIRLGYGNYSPEDDNKPSFLASIIQDRQGAIIRMVWGFLVGIITPIAIFFMGYLLLPSYIAYIVTNASVNYSVSKFRLPMIVADVCVSLAFGSLLFYI